MAEQGLHPEVEAMMDKSPRPLVWFTIQLVLVVAAFWLWSVVIGIAAGITIGLYFGNYRGRFAIMDAWRRQMYLDHERDMAELEAEYKALVESER